MRYAPTLLTLACLPWATCPWADAACSDAGICRLSATHGSGPDEAADGSWEVGVRAGIAAGSAEHDVAYRTINLGIAWQPVRAITLGLDLPFTDLDGPLGEASGAGDALVRGSWRFADTEHGWFAALAGSRLPTGDDNVNPGLPQAYQLGLGPADLLVGLGWGLGGWTAGIGYLVAGGANGLDGTELERGDDLAVHLGYAHTMGAWTFGLSIIPIARLAESTVATPAGRVEVEGSDGLQVNLRPTVSWRLDSTWSVQALYEVPLLERDSDVDGLTRQYGLEAGLLARF